MFGTLKNKFKKNTCECICIKRREIFKFNFGCLLEGKGDILADAYMYIFFKKN